MHSLLVSRIFIYPVKSLGGIEVSSSEILPKGLAYDRRWMLIDENNCFLTQRWFPKMALIKLAIDGGINQIFIHFGGSSFVLPESMGGEVLRAKIWEDVVEVMEPDIQVSKWFSEVLGVRCKLVSFHEESPRPVDPNFAIRQTDQTSLSDGYPILLVGQSSLNDLNARLAEKVGPDRFRPNIVFTGGVPFEEDSFTRFSIGGIAMAGVKPCARCVMTTIDQQTALAGKEPLATLNQYRKVGNKILFGQNVIPLETGSIKVGDQIILQQ